MAKIDEIKAWIDWLKDAVKILVVMLLAIGAGVSKLFLSNQINILFFIGIFLVALINFLIPVLLRRINELIKELGGIE